MCVCVCMYVCVCPSLQVSSQLDTFRKQLEQFASKHKSEIRKDAEFRGHFQQMCARIGVDPLACELQTTTNTPHGNWTAITPNTAHISCLPVSASRYAYTVFYMGLESSYIEI